MREIFKKTLLYKYLKKINLLNNEYRRYLLINFIFQRIFGLNRECSWGVNFTSTVVCAKNIKIGHNVHKSFTLSGNCYFQAINGIIIGDGTIFAAGVKIISANHELNDSRQHTSSEGIVIGKNCWIGANVVILPRVYIADNVIIGAGSIVTKSVTEERSIVAGNPAKLIGRVDDIS